MSISRFKDMQYDKSNTQGYLCNTITEVIADSGEKVYALEVFNDPVINSVDPARPITSTNLNATINEIEGQFDTKLNNSGNGTTTAITADGKTISYKEIGCLDGVSSLIQSQLNTKTEKVGSGTTTAITADGKAISYKEIGYLTGAEKPIQEQLNAILLKVYPVGAIYMSVNSTNPHDLFGGSWVAWGSGRVPVGIDTTQTEFNAVEKNGGEKTHVLRESEMPAHNHVKGISGYNNTNDTPRYVYGSQINTSPTTQLYVTGYNFRAASQYAGLETCGSNVSHNNLQPYLTCYMWKRIG